MQILLPGLEHMTLAITAQTAPTLKGFRTSFSSNDVIEMYTKLWVQ